MSKTELRRTWNSDRLETAGLGARLAGDGGWSSSGRSTGREETFGMVSQLRVRRTGDGGCGLGRLRPDRQASSRLETVAPVSSGLGA